MYEHLQHTCHKVYSIKYHMKFCVKYRKDLFDDDRIMEFFKETLKSIGEKYYLTLETIGIEINHVHLLVLSTPRYSPSRVVQVIKSITAIELFKKFPKIKEELWDGEFWNNTKYIGTVSEGTNTNIIRNYIRKQGRPTKQPKLSKF